MLLIAQANAKANGRDIILAHDLPVTKGLMLDLGYGVDVEEKLPEIVGTLTVSLAKTFKIIDPKVKNPQTDHWERAEAIFNMLL